MATTRPETIFGDTALAVHTSNTNYVGHFAIVQLINRSIPIVMDHFVDANFGTNIYENYSCT